MKTINKALLCLLLLSTILLGQAQVTINTTLIPPTSSSIEDFKSLSKVNVLFISNTTAFGIPQVIVTGNNGIVLTSNRVVNSYTPSGLTANIPTSITSTQLNQLFDIANLLVSGMNSQQLMAFRETGSLPDGVYSVCFEFWSIGTAFVKISNPAPNGCATWIIGSGSSYSNSLREPPRTILPACQINAIPVVPQQLVFTWFNPSAFSELTEGTQEYLIKMVEVPGNKSPFDAIATTSVPPLFEKTVFGTSYVYGLADPPLIKGKKYAYVVAVKTNNRKYQNNGVSEVCWFTYGDTSAVKGTTAETKVPKNTKPVKTGTVTFTPSAVFEPLPTTTIKGKLVYAFRKTELPKADLSAIDISTSGKNVELSKGNAFDNLENLTSTQASSQTNSGIWEAMNEGSSGSPGTSGYSPMIGGTGSYSVEVSDMQDMGSILDKKSAEETGWQDVVASNAAEAGPDRFPLSNSYVEVRLFMKDEMIKAFMKMKKIDPFMKMPKNGILLGTAKTDNEGNFSVTYNKGDIEFAFYYAELLVVNGTQFDYPVLPIPIELGNFGVYDLGEILGLANTFRLNVKVIGAAGKKLETANVKVLRTNGFYGDKMYLDPEGNRFYGGNTTEAEKPKEKEENKSGYGGYEYTKTYTGLEAIMEMFKMELVAENNTHRKFSRLFEANGPDEYYTLQITAEDHKSLNTPLLFIPNGDLNFSGSGTHSSTNNGILTVSATYFLVPEKPKVKGRVIDKTTEVPMPDITVTLYSEDKSKIYTTKTGPDGKFLIKNIEARKDPYILKLNGATIKEWIDPSKIFLETDGITVNRDPLYVSAQLIPVMGVVSDLVSIPLNNAELKWKNGGKSFYTASNGHYMGYNVAGKHTLIISKPGFKTKEIQVDLSLGSSGEKKSSPIYKKVLPANSGSANKALEEIANQYGNIVLGSLNGIDFTPASKKPAKPGNAASAYNVLIGEGKIDLSLESMLAAEDIAFGSAVTLDTIKLSQFYVNVKVTDKDSKAPIANAIVTVNDDEKEYKTNTEGMAVLSNVPEGSSTIYIAAPSGTNYVAASASIAVQPSKDTTFVEVSLSGGAKLSGKVTSAGAAVADAEIFVEGKSYIKTKSDASGNYGFGVPVGEYTIIASKTGFVADKKTLTFEKKDYTQDFELKDPGFDATKILGFDLILYDSKPEATPNEFKITGAITHIPSNALFSISNSKKLEFFEQVVVKDGSIIVPKSGSLNLADAQLDFKLFEYLNVNLKNAGGLKVKANGGDNTKGIISGELQLDVNKTFGNNYGLTWPAGAYKLNTGTPGDVNAFYSGGGLPVPATSLKLNAPAAGWEIYGVKLTPDFNNTSVDKEGISFAGKIDLNDIPGLGAATLTIKTLQIGTNGDIKKLEINLSPNPTIDFLSWKMVLKNVSLNQYGLRFGGELTIPIPGSDPAVFQFSDVNVNSTGLNGGTYALKGQINFFGVADFKGLPGNPLSFSKIPGSTNYKLNGGGSLKFGSLLNKAVDIQNFLLATNGEIGFTAEPNLDFDFAGGMASFKLGSLGFYPSKYEFSVNGGFGLAIPGISGSAGGSIHYAKSKVSIDKLSIAASMGGIGGFSADVEFGTDKFYGAGDLNIAGFAGMGMSFEYKKLSGGKLIKAAISTGIIIPVGIVTFEKIGGGFTYNSSAGKYGVNLTGRMVLAPGTSAVVALENIIVGVETNASPPGARLFGSAEPNLMSMNVGVSEFELNIPNKSFYISTTIGKSLNFIPGVSMSASGGFMLAASAKSSDPYWLMGVYTHMNMLGLFNNNLNITGAWNLNRAAHPEFNDYTLFIPDAYLNSGKINGVHCVFKSLQGRMSDNPHCGGISDIAELCAYAYANMDLRIHSNFASGTYGFDVSQEWGAGGSANFFGIGVAGAEVSVGFGLSGAYGGGNWSINGNGSANAKAYIGCSGGGCGNGISWGCCFDPCFWDSCEVCPCPCGGKICIHPSVTVGYSSSSGKFDLDLNW